MNEVLTETAAEMDAWSKLQPVKSFDSPLSENAKAREQILKTKRQAIGAFEKTKLSVIGCVQKNSMLVVAKITNRRSVMVKGDVEIQCDGKQVAIIKDILIAPQ